MGRRIAFNEDMADLAARIASHMSEQRLIRARYAAKAEREIADQRAEILRIMVNDFPDAGPSEFANSTGISRSTAVRWLEEARSRHLHLSGQVEERAAEAGPKFGAEPNQDGDLTAYIEHGGRRLYLLMGDTFGYGESVEDADRPGNLIPAPDWLTEDMMRQAVEATGATLMFAPWDVRERSKKKEK